MTEMSTFVRETRLRLGDGVEPRAAGGAVTVALCGSWDHEGPCRWPHHSAIAESGGVARLRTVVAAPAAEVAEVRLLIDAALAAGPGWVVLGADDRRLAGQEAALARRLAEGPRRS